MVRTNVLVSIFFVVLSSSGIDGMRVVITDLRQTIHAEIDKIRGNHECILRCLQRINDCVIGMKYYAKLQLNMSHKIEYPNAREWYLKQRVLFERERNMYIDELIKGCSALIAQYTQDRSEIIEWQRQCRSDFTESFKQLEEKIGSEIAWLQKVMERAF